MYSKYSGYIQDIDAKEIGKLACDLGAGRIRKEDTIKPEVGIVLNKKVADKVEKNEILGYIHSDDMELLDKAKKRMLEIIKIQDRKIQKLDTIIKVI